MCIRDRCDPTRLVICAYTLERLLIWLEKMSRIKLIMARWKYEPYAWTARQQGEEDNETKQLQVVCAL